MSSELFQHINYDKAYRKNRLGAAEWVLEHPENIEELVAYCFVDDKELAKKATWVLEFVCRKELSLLYPYLNYFFERLPKAEGDGALRAVGLICELLALAYYKSKDQTLRPIFTSRHKEIMTECCFDWLITDQKVACQARAMLALFWLGTEIDWIHTELATVIHQHLPTGSAGYINRGQKVLHQIDKFAGT